MNREVVASLMEAVSEQCGCALTVQDVSQALSAEQLLQSGHFVLQLTHQLIVGILIDNSVAFDVLGSVSVATKKLKNPHQDSFVRVSTIQLVFFCFCFFAVNLSS